MGSRRDIVVIGASSGGIEALRHLVAKLPAELGAAIFIVQHTGANSPGVMGDILARAGRLPARAVIGCEPIAFGEIRVAPPDHHLVLTPEGVRVDRGPTENRVRPAIDVLFRSAAVAFGSRVVGIVLTGNLSDGSAGLRAIKQCGGTTMVQSPEEAAFPDMPRNAIRCEAPDFIGTLDELAAELIAVIGQPAPVVVAPEHVVLQAPMGYRTGEASVVANDRLGASTSMVCTDCGGPLWQVDGPRLQFRCAIGHAMNGDVLLAGKTEELARALGFVLRTLDEKGRLLATMAKRHREEHRHNHAELCERKLGENASAVETVRGLLESLGAHSDA